MTVETTLNKALQEHPIYWFDDGLLTLRIQDTLFRVHHSFICRQSRVLLGAVGSPSTSATLHTLEHGEESTHGDSQYHSVKTTDPVLSTDFEELLRHLYHDDPLSQLTPFKRVVSLLRVSSPRQLDFALIHSLARAQFERLLPAIPLVLKPDTHHIYEGLQIATQFGFSEVRKAILYMLVTTHHFDEQSDIKEEQSTLIQSPHTETSVLDDAIMGQTANASIQGSHSSNYISKEDRVLCESLLDCVIQHFTPILYTPANASHMACTNVLADLWMSYVIQPSLEDDGIYKPLETLERIKNVAWERDGLCPACAVQKRKEWTEDQATVWRLLDEWILRIEKFPPD